MRCPLRARGGGKGCRGDGRTNDAVKRLQHIAVAGDLQRVAAIRNHHDGLPPAASATARRRRPRSEQCRALREEGCKRCRLWGTSAHPDGAGICPCASSWPARRMRAAAAPAMREQGGEASGARPRRCGVRRAARTECSSSFDSSRSNRVKASAVAPARGKRRVAWQPCGRGSRRDAAGKEGGPAKEGAGRRRRACKAGDDVLVRA